MLQMTFAKYYSHDVLTISIFNVIDKTEVHFN